MRGIRGLMTTEEVGRLVGLARLVPRWAAIVELGTHTGFSTCHMADVAKAHVTSIDPYPDPRPGSQDDPFGFGSGDGAMQEFHRNLSEHRLWDRVTALRATSVEVARLWVQPVGLLFIDAVHERRAVEEDYRAWERFIPSGGWLALHDHHESYPGVIETVDEVILPTGEWERAALVGTLWTARRR